MGGERDRAEHTFFLRHDLRPVLALGLGGVEGHQTVPLCAIVGEKKKLAVHHPYGRDAVLLRGLGYKPLCRRIRKVLEHERFAETFAATQHKQIVGPFGHVG